ncbi:MAG: 1-deoxy-D-xylulose-5-phosphate synthase N-terminal domain-containing protein, partial [Candidatus Omnitrophota bacterium]
MSRIIDTINSPDDLRKLKLIDLPVLAKEIRHEILSTVSKTGGHLSSSLGAVELAIAIHYSFSTPHDRLLWDVGHQAYAHKIITGRAKYFSTLRQLGGLSGFPNKDESPEYDIFTCGHSSTSISTGLGLVMSGDLGREG